MGSEGEIEYLDEDAEIVQQLVQPLEQNITVPQSLLLVERPKGNKRTRKRQDDSSDYDPNEESPPSPGPIKKKRPIRRSKVSTPTKKMSTPLKIAAKTPVRLKPNTPVHLKPNTPVRLKPNTNYLPVTLTRKRMDIRIPDYDDPLCMPVRALNSVDSDLQRLKNWNNACLEHFKQCDTLLKPENGQTKSSSRTIILSHKESGKYETALWSKTCVTNTKGVKKSEIFQSILPKYKEKRMLEPYNLLPMDRKRKVHHQDEVILTKEKNKEDELLVVYRPKESLSTVYKFIKAGESQQNPDDEPKRVLKEVACCKVCAPCYQMSWRGTKDTNTNTELVCPLCGRSISSVYNFLTHIKGHRKKQILANRAKISALLAGLLDYHYKCRVCQKKLPTIKTLRRHVSTHRASVAFRCEIGNHMTR